MLGDSNNLCLEHLVSMLAGLELKICTVLASWKGPGSPCSMFLLTQSY